MSNYLVFHLQGALASWGAPAVGEVRDTFPYPGKSAVLGMIGAALGWTREQDEDFARLQSELKLGVAVLSEGHSLIDFHTAQVPSAVAQKGMPAFTRADELRALKQWQREKNKQATAILSWREYRSDGSWLVALQGDGNSSLSALADALRSPKFTLYLGRKACPPGQPLWPQVIDAEHLLAAFHRYVEMHAELSDQLLADGMTLHWESDMEPGPISGHGTYQRDDLIRSRRRWQFAKREEHRGHTNAGGA